MSFFMVLFVLSLASLIKHSFQLVTAVCLTKLGIRYSKGVISGSFFIFCQAPLSPRHNLCLFMLAFFREKVTRILYQILVQFTMISFSVTYKLVIRLHCAWPFSVLFPLRFSQNFRHNIVWYQSTKIKCANSFTITTRETYYLCYDSLDR